MTPASARTTSAPAKRKPRLRELGLYTLPDGREYVVSTLYSDGFSLYHTRTWGSFGNAEYWVNQDGQILRYGVPTNWTVRDLEDTGRTTHYPKPNIR